MLAPILETFNLARQHRNQSFTAIVIIGSFVFALALGMALKEHLHVLARIGVHKFTEGAAAERQEIVNYLAALTFVPLFTLFSCGFWVVFSALCATRTGNAKERILRQNALTYLILLLVLGRVYLPSRFAGQVGTPASLFIIAQVSFFSYHLIQSQKGVGVKNWNRARARRAWLESPKLEKFFGQRRQCHSMEYQSPAGLV